MPEVGEEYCHCYQYFHFSKYFLGEVMFHVEEGFQLETSPVCLCIFFI